MARAMPDNPMIWKLTDPFLDAICKFCNIEEHEKVLSLTFLDASVDITSTRPILICETASYPVDLRNLGA